MVAAVGLVAVLSNLSAIERLYAIAKEIRVREALAHPLAEERLAASVELTEARTQGAADRDPFKRR